MTTDLKSRMAQLPRPGVEQTLRLGRGSLRDYSALSAYHYRSDRPATATRVLTLRHDAPTVVGRFVQRRDESAVVAVLVESLPSLACRLRDHALHDRYAAAESFPARAGLLSQELRCISRVVVHPQWRGLGLAVRLVRESLADPVTMFTEALAAMGHVNPFFERAGMTAYHRPAHPFDARLCDALASAGFSPIDLAALDQLQARLAALPETPRLWLETELRRWYCRTRRSSQSTGPLREHLLAARRRLLCDPVYYLKDNRHGNANHPAGEAGSPPVQQQRDAGPTAGEARRPDRSQRPIPAGDRPAAGG